MRLPVKKRIKVIKSYHAITQPVCVGKFIWMLVTWLKDSEEIHLKTVILDVNKKEESFITFDFD